MRKYEFIAMSALLLAAENPNSDMSATRRTIILMNNEMAMISGQAPFARSESAKLKWLKKLDVIENDLDKLLKSQANDDLTASQKFSLEGTRESIVDMRNILSPRE